MENAGDKSKLGKESVESNINGENVEEKHVSGDDNAASTAHQDKKKVNPKKPIRTFPQFSIKEAMKIAKTIGEYNAGNPWTPEHIASVLGFSKNTNSFFYLTSASRDYGFTTGTSRAKTIELTALGRKLVFPESPVDEASSIKEAFNNIEVFKKVIEYYHGTNFPEDQYLCNTLKENFDVDPSYHADFLRIFKENINLINQYGYVKSDTTAMSVLSPDTKLVRVEQAGNSKELFVIIPFKEKTQEYPKGYFDEVYNSLIVPAAEKAGYTAKTAKRSGSDVIQSTIVSDIYKADIILADLTEHNPNVLFELGLAIAFKKKVALIKADDTLPIFDIDNLMRVYSYDKKLWKSTLEKDITSLGKHIEATAQTSETTYLELLLKRS